MKSSILLLFALFTNSVFAQLSFPAANFTPLSGTNMEVLNDSGNFYLSFNRTVATGQKGFQLNLTGSRRTDLGIDVPVYSESPTPSSFQVEFPGSAKLWIDRSTMERASIYYNTVSGGSPVQQDSDRVVVYDEAGRSNEFTVSPGTIGSLQLASTDVVPEPGKSPVMAPYLLDMNVRPDGNKTLLELHFHDKMEFNIGDTTITGNRLDLWINASYTSIPAMYISTNGIEAPISVYYYEWRTMPPSLRIPEFDDVYTTQEVVFTGENLDYVDAVIFDGRPLTFISTDSVSLNVQMPETPGSGELTLLSEHGDHISSFKLNVIDKPDCSIVPDPYSLFFYPIDTQTISVVYKWNYNGNISSSFDVEYREVGTPAWNTTNTGSTNEFVMTNATPGTNYEFRVRARCPNLLLSEWSEGKVIGIAYTDEINVSNELNGVLREWREDTTHYLPMDSFLNIYNGPIAIDAREATGFIHQFFGPIDFPLRGFPALNSTGDCLCKKVYVDLDIVRINNGPKEYKDEVHKQGPYIVGKRLQWYKYFGASQRNAMLARDFKSWCDEKVGGTNKRRHTDRNNKLEMSRTVGDTPYSYTQAFTTLSMSYICANKVSRVMSSCGCEKKVYITAESKVRICVEGNSSCSDPFFWKTHHDNGCRAEAGFGSIIFTGLLTGNPGRLLNNIKILAAGHYNVYRERNYASTLNRDFIKKAVSLLYNGGIAAALGATTGGTTAEVLESLIKQGYLDRVKDDLVGLVGTRMYDIVYDSSFGSDACKHYSIVPAADPFYITLYPNEERYVTIATTSYTGIKAWGCYYNVKSSMDASHHLAAATNRSDSSDNAECCIVPTGAYSANSISEEGDEQPADNGHKQAVGKLFEKYGDKERIPNSLYSDPYWLDKKGSRVSFDDDDDILTPWIIPGGSYTTHGRLQGRPDGCNVNQSPSQPFTGLGDKSVTKEKTTLSVYPNTAHNSTNIEYTLSAASYITLTIYDMSGRKVAVLTNNEKKESGTYHLEADLSKLAHGQYIVLLTSNSMNAYQYLVKE